MIDRNTVKDEVFEGVAELTPSYTADQLEEDWILGGGAAQEDSVGLAAFVITTKLIPSMNLYIQVVREDENKIPLSNPLKKSDIGTGTKLGELVDLVFAKIQEDLSRERSTIKIQVNKNTSITLDINNG